MPLDWANWMIAENEKDRQSETQSSEIFSKKRRNFSFDSKIEKLMNAYLENALSLDEFRESKVRWSIKTASQREIISF